MRSTVLHLGAEFAVSDAFTPVEITGLAPCLPSFGLPRRNPSPSSPTDPALPCLRDAVS